MKYSLGISNFLEEISVFPFLLFSSISLHWSLRKALLSLLAILWNSAFRCLYLSFSPLLFASLLFTAICKASSDSHFAFLHFFPWGWSWSLCPVQYHEPLSIVHQESFYLKKTMVDLQCCINFYKDFTNGHHQMVNTEIRLIIFFAAKMKKLYTVNINKTRSWLWLRSWTPYCQIQTSIEESRENH